MNFPRVLIFSHTIFNSAWICSIEGQDIQKCQEIIICNETTFFRNINTVKAKLYDAKLSRLHYHSYSTFSLPTNGSYPQK